MASKATERKPNETDHGAEEANKSSGAAAQSGSGKSSSDESHGQSTQAQNKDGQQGKAAKSGGEGKDAVELIKEDHRRVEKLFDQFQQSRNFNQKKRLVEQICIELNTHTLVEEQIFYPACRGKVEDDLLDEAQVEHDGCKQLIMELQNSSPVDQYYEAKVKVLSEYVRHHVAEEEKTGDGILDAARKAGVDMMALGQEIEQRRPDLQQQAIDDPEPDMPSMDEGRSSQAGRSQQQRGGYASSQGGQGRASQGGGGSRQGSGWYGDAEGHAQAARRGHQQEDGRRYASQSRGGASRYDEDERGGGRGHGGWFGDPEGHSQAARGQHRGGYGDDRQTGSGGGRSQYRDAGDERGGRDQGHGGWFGDPEGHSQASRRGWEQRGHDDDDRRYATSQGGGRYRDDDDDDDGGRGSGGRYGR